MKLHPAWTPTCMALALSSSLASAQSSPVHDLWKTEQQLSFNGALNEVSHNSIAGGAGSVMHAVWNDLGSNGSRIAYARSTTGGESWEPDENLFQITFDTADPQVHADGQGIVHVAWSDSIQFLIRSSVDDGDSFLPWNVQVADETSFIEDFDVALDSSGNLHFLWTNLAPTPTLKYRVLSPQSVLGPIESITTGTSTLLHPRLTVDSAGVVQATWVSNPDILALGLIALQHATRIPNQGWNSPQEAHAPVRTGAKYSALTMDNDGGLHLVSSTQGPREIRYHRLQAAGTQWDSRVLDPDGGATILGASLAQDTFGELHVALLEQAATLFGSGYQFRWARSWNQGSAWTPFRNAGNTDGNVQRNYLALGAGNDGRMHMISSGLGPGTGVNANRFSFEDGDIVSPPEWNRVRFSSAAELTWIPNPGLDRVVYYKILRKRIGDPFFTNIAFADDGVATCAELSSHYLTMDCDAHPELFDFAFYLDTEVPNLYGDAYRYRLYAVHYRHGSHGFAVSSWSDSRHLLPMGKLTGLGTPDACTVTQADYDALADAFLSSPGETDWNPDADFDRDGLVEVHDLQLLNIMDLWSLPAGVTCEY